MSEEIFDNIVYSKNVIEFVTVANEYCNFVESNGKFGRFEFVDSLHKILPLVYLKTCMIPEIDDENAETPEKFVTEIDYNYLLNKISAKLAQFDGYQEVFESGMQFSEDAIEATISENICDIYQDLKDFIMTYRIGTEEIMADALWECKNNFNSYWGQKLTNCMRALHAIRYGDEDLESEDEQQIESEDDIDRKGNWVSKHFNNYSEDEESTEYGV